MCGDLRRKHTPRVQAREGAFLLCIVSHVRQEAVKSRVFKPRTWDTKRL